MLVANDTWTQRDDSIPTEELVCPSLQPREALIAVHAPTAEEPVEAENCYG